MKTILGIFHPSSTFPQAFSEALDAYNARLDSPISFKVVSPAEDRESLIRHAKAANAVLLGDVANADLMLRALLSALKLHTCVRMDGSRYHLVTTANSDLSEAESGYDADAKFGRAAYDLTRISELEIESSARVAYELAEQEHSGMLLADRASMLVTSRLWRKIVADINEDYPTVPVTMTDLANFFGKEKPQQGVILTSRLFADLVWSYLDINIGFDAYLGDTPVALYHSLNNSSSFSHSAPLSNASDPNHTHPLPTDSTFPHSVPLSNDSDHKHTHPLNNESALLLSLPHLLSTCFNLPS